ncbi:alpha/beta hydrolase [Roseovarius faecimaris]|uniref:Alpha/beta hydrolase n=1 Tax=Roseovarius faecimaris TaxID=2494550 RepID=A0A6I6IP24_9RHOB|nr:alpha/beta hydrolase [Roseovarius faecimaris]QGX98890.1 alpha/beta hydrolase [Roseovarius faecimaris]
MARFTTSDGLSLHYEDEGDGPAVLCLAGLTRNVTDFTYLVPHLPDHRVIRMDYRGRGQSEYAEDFMSYNILREGQDAVELMDHLGLERVTLMGTSRGGLIAMALSVTHPGRMNGVILNDIGPEVTDLGIARIMAYVGLEPPYETLDQAAEALKAGFAESFPDVPLSRWREQAEFMWYDKPGGGVGIRYDTKLRDALIGQAGVGEAPDLWQLFDGLKDLPLACIRGQNSDLFAQETFEAMAARHPGMIGAVVPDRGHVPFLDEPEALAAIRQLLEQVQ